VISPVVSSVIAHTGFAFTVNYIRVKITLGQYFPLTNPNLNTYFAIHGKGKYVGVINFHTEGVQGNAPLFDFFCTCNFCAAQTPANLYLDTLGTQTKR